MRGKTISLRKPSSGRRTSLLRVVETAEEAVETLSRFFGA